MFFLASRSAVNCHPKVLFVAAALALLGGCQTVNDRIKADSALFASLDPARQARIKHGYVNRGDSPEIVYLALGKPSEKNRLTSAGEAHAVWIYNYYCFDALGKWAARLDYRQRVYFDQSGRVSSFEEGATFPANRHTENPNPSDAPPS